MLQNSANLQTLRSTPIAVFGGERELFAKKTFKNSFEIYLKDSNAYTNTYFSRYFEWQGVCRERWFHQCIAADFLQGQGAFVTKQAHQDYVQETFPFQTVECFLNTFQVRQTSCHLLFRFFVNGQLVSRGYQQIVFISNDKKIIRFPDEVVRKLKEYETVLDGFVHN